MKKALQNIGVSKMWKKIFLVCACILDDGVLYWGHSYYLNKNLVTMDFSLNLIMASHIINFWKYMSWGCLFFLHGPPFSDSVPPLTESVSTCDLWLCWCVARVVCLHNTKHSLHIMDIMHMGKNGERFFLKIFLFSKIRKN